MEMINFGGTHHGGSFGSPKVDVCFTDVTLTIRAFDFNGRYKDLHILTKDILEVNEVGNDLEVKFKDPNLGWLVIDTKKAVEAFRQQYQHKKFLRKESPHFWSRFNVKIVLLTALVIGMILAIIFWFLPWMGNRLLRSFPKAYEVQLGSSLIKPSIGESKIDSARSALLNEFYKELHYPTEYPICITVVESEELNAFALPGGPIVVYNSLLDKMKSPEELAALLSHEAAHIQNRHTLRNMLSEAGTKILIGLLLGDQSGAVALLASQANELKGLAYSRALETEADQQGLEWMRQRQLDQNGMLRLMQIFQSASNGAEPVAFLSTHPIFSERTAAIQAIIQAPKDVPAKNDLTLDHIFKQLHSTDF